MSEPMPRSDASVRWPADRFYWAVLDTPPTGPWICKGPLPTALLEEVGDQIPESVEGVHAVCTPDPSGRLIVCAANRADLANVGAAVTSLVPESLPGWVDSTGMNPASLNLRVGAFEPVESRRARARSRLLTTATLVLGGVLMMFGSVRREIHDRRQAAAAEQASRVLLAGPNLPKLTDADLRAEIERARRLAAVDLGKLRSPDAAAQLQALLRGWPTSIPARPQSIVVNPEGMTVAVLVHGDAAGFVEEFKPPENWMVESPSLVNVGQETRVNLHLRPRTAGGHP